MPDPIVTPVGIIAVQEAPGQYPDPQTLGKPSPPSAKSEGPLVLAVIGGIILAGGLAFAGLAIDAARPVESCPENCRLGREIGKIVGGAGAGVLGLSGVIMLGVGLDQYISQKPRR